MVISSRMFQFSFGNCYSCPVTCFPIKVLFGMSCPQLSLSLGSARMQAAGLEVTLPSWVSPGCFLREVWSWGGPCASRRLWFVWTPCLFRADNPALPGHHNTGWTWKPNRINSTGSYWGYLALPISIFFQSPDKPSVWLLLLYQFPSQP